MPALTLNCTLNLGHVEDVSHFMAYLSAYRSPNLPAAEPPPSPPQPVAVLTPEAMSIYRALADRPLNDRQSRILNYWADNYPQASAIADLIEVFVDEGFATSADEADDLIRGALRSFGRRLKEASYDAGTDMPPIRRLVDIRENDGRRHHQITADGLAAVRRLLRS